MIPPLTDLIRIHYDNGLDDYWLPALIKCSAEGSPICRVHNGDVFIFACRRGEREIQLTEAFVDPNFGSFPRRYLPDLRFFPMIEYHSKFAGHAALFPTIRPPYPLGEVLASHELSQLRIAEAEKMAHVTYYFNGRREHPHPGEEWITIPSIKPGSNPKPEMGTLEVAETLITALSRADYRFALVNFAAGDIFGHIPDFQAQVECVEVIDHAVGTIAGFCREARYCLIITADHGLLEQAYLPDGGWSLGHTQAAVPFALIDPAAPWPDAELVHDGTLADVAPTILHLLGIDPPQAMTGKPLLKPYVTRARGVILLILDGFGVGEQNPQVNPIYAAATPNLDSLFRQHPYTQLQASGASVGLRPLSSGNSETGHLTLGSGRVVIQDEVRIPAGITPEQLSQNQAFYTSIVALRPGQAVHILFLLSPGSSHGSMGEAIELVSVLKHWGVKQVYLHAISDGRSAPRCGAVQLLPQLQMTLEKLGTGEIVTVCGRGYMLDRSRLYQERTRYAYEALVEGSGAFWQEI